MSSDCTNLSLNPSTALFTLPRRPRMDVCARRSTHIYLPIRVYAPWYRFNVYRSRQSGKIRREATLDLVYREMLANSLYWGGRRGQVLDFRCNEESRDVPCKNWTRSLISLWISSIFVYFILHGISYLKIDAMVDDGTFEEENSFDRNKFIEIVNFYVTSKFTRFVCKDGLNSSAAALFLPRHTYWL